MRSALCLHGIVGGVRGKDGKGDTVDFKECRNAYLKNVIVPNNCDVFLHSWSIDHEPSVVAAYQPKLSKFQPLHQFKLLFKHLPHMDDEYRIRSRWLSYKTVVELKRVFEQEQSFKYDFVMVARYDLLFLTPFDFSELSPHHFYASNWNNHRKVKVPRRDNSSPRSHRLQDTWFVASSEMMDQFSGLYDSLDEYVIRPTQKPVDVHSHIWWHLDKVFGSAEKVLRYKLYRGHDYELYRVVHGFTEF